MLAAAGASVKDIFHERAWLHTSVDQVTIKAVLETLGPEHNHAQPRRLLPGRGRHHEARGHMDGGRRLEPERPRGGRWVTPSRSCTYVTLAK